MKRDEVSSWRTASGNALEAGLSRTRAAASRWRSAIPIPELGGPLAERGGMTVIEMRRKSKRWGQPPSSKKSQQVGGRDARVHQLDVDAIDPTMAPSGNARNGRADSQRGHENFAGTRRTGDCRRRYGGGVSALRPIGNDCSGRGANAF